MCYEGRLQWMQVIPDGNTFDCCNRTSRFHYCQGQTAKNSFAIADDGTGTTLAMITTLFGAGKLTMVTEGIQ